jgi:hypothetical protein
MKFLIFLAKKHVPYLAKEILSFIAGMTFVVSSSFALSYIVLVTISEFINPEWALIYNFYEFFSASFLFGFTILFCIFVLAILVTMIFAAIEYIVKAYQEYKNYQ